MESDLEVIAAGDSDPERQSPRVRQWRPVVVAASSLGIVASVVAIALLLSVRSDIGDLRADIKEERQERRQALTTITGELRTAIPDAGAFAGPICPPAVKADAIGADGLPPAGSDVEVREHVDELLRSNEQKIRGAFPEVEGLAVGAGRGRAWVRDHTGTVSVVKVEDFAIHAHVPSVEACPSPERQSAWPVNIPLIFVIGSGG